MKAYKINVHSNKVEVVDYKTFESIHQHGEFDLFTTGARLPNGDTVWVDDEGLLNGTTRAFRWDGQLLMGNGVVCGGDNMGETVDAASTIAEIESHIEWFPEWVRIAPSSILTKA